MSFSQNLKKAAWTEAEVVAAVAGATVSQKYLDIERFFKQDLAMHPEWFVGNRDHAPLHIKHFGLLKAVGATLASTYVKNPWIKLAAMGVAFQGTLEEMRVLTFKDGVPPAPGHTPFRRIGADEGALDAALKHAAETHRMNGMDGMDGAGHSYGDNQGNRFSSEVAGGHSYGDNQGNRFSSEVAAPILGIDDMGEPVYAAHHQAHHPHHPHGNVREVEYREHYVQHNRHPFNTWSDVGVDAL